MLRNASISKRLLIGAAVFITLALLMAAIVIFFALHRFVQGQIDQRLDTQIVFLSSMLRAGPDGALRITGNADGPPFDRPGNGWYWQIMGPKNNLRSTALRGAGLDVPDITALPPPPPPPPPPPAGQDGPPPGEKPRPADGPGPDGRPLHFRVLTVPVAAVSATIVASAPRAAVIGPLREAMTTLAISLGVLGLGLVLATLLQVRLGLRPLEQLCRSVADVRAGRSERVPPEQPLEVQPLVSELNALLEQNASNLERARRHVANLAHGLKTPLATLSIALSERGRASADELSGLVTVMERRIRHHLGRARVAALSGPVRARTTIASHIADLGNVLVKVNADKGVTFAVDIPARITVACEPQDFDEMAGNLMENAFNWAKAQVRIEARTDGRTITLAIHDDGPGLQSEQIPQVLKPGARLDENAPGFGFGLAITRELAELYGGDIALGPSPLGGLRVSLRLPQAAGA